ncbi:ParB/RepB/Spo0J family partition protein [Tateyamaria sp. ANG-S1]|uniref:ParB/RepB/Spo0J family partition protein n=1 Tax=Tateyamaria sp. ANG-S1 TaxID=1577905 RepID=UPI00057FED54|nr:ParB/RepB/Spo0J family partition protein [Tateyamaria sp. ANG-S1]KIC49794.1 chromosome partitioning protein ParB [Tateyamaria sp. ANG-S1]
MANNDKKRGLGRGLSALMADVNEPAPQAASAGGAGEQQIPIEKIKPNPNQPRRQFEAAPLEDLVASIKEKGVLQPLIVRPLGEGFEIVAGERRWRAAQQAQLHELPVLVRDFTDTEVLEVAIIENIQRADLNPMEEAAGYRQLMDRFGHTQEKMAEALGKSRSHIANLLRLLQLPDSIQSFVMDGALSAGHARALITAADPLALAKTVIVDGLSVRATEALVKKEGEGSGNKNFTGLSKPKVVEKDADTRALEDDLSAATGVKVSLTHKPDGESGTLTLQYKTLDQLDDLCRRLSTS